MIHRPTRAAAALAAAIAFLPASALAVCDVENPVVSLTEGLVVTDPLGREIDRLGYLEVVSSPQFQRTLPLEPRGERPRTIEIVTADGETGEVAADQVLTYQPGLASCVADRLRMFHVPRSENDLDNTLQAKAFIGIREKALERLAPGEEPQGIAFRAGPSEDARVIERRKRYLMGFVYAEHRDPESPRSWYFIGRSGDAAFRLDDEGRLASRIERGMLGWISSDDMVLWPQRQALYPRDGRADMTIYADPQLEEALVDIEWEDEATPERTQSILKYSLLDRAETDGVFQIAFPQLAAITEGVDAPPAAAGDAPRPTVQAADDTRVILDRLRDETSQVDVLFVLDNTESMVQYRGPVMSGIADLNEMASLDRDTMRIAVAMFGDVFDGRGEANAWANARGGFDPAWLALMPPAQPFQFWLEDFGPSGDLPTVDELAADFGTSPYNDPQADLEEAGLLALDVAIRSASWRSGSVRLVVYVGDDASRLFAGSDAGESAARIARLLKQYRAVLLPVNVAGKRVDSRNRTWQAQAETIGEVARRLGGTGGALPPTVSYGTRGVSDQVEARRGVRETVTGLFALQESASAGFSIGEICARADALNISCNIPLRLLELYTDASVSDLEALQLRTDLLRVGFYPQDAAEIFVALSAPERQGLESAFDTVCVSMSNPEIMQREMIDMTDELTEGFLGESRVRARGYQPGETIQDFFSRMTYLPADYFGIFGGRTIAGFVDHLFDLQDNAPDRYRAIQEEICLAARLFESVGNREFAFRGAFASRFDDRFQAFDFEPRQPLKDFEWQWGVGGGLSLYFVPQSFFPRAVEG